MGQDAKAELARAEFESRAHPLSLRGPERSPFPVAPTSCPAQEGNSKDREAIARVPIGLFPQTAVVAGSMAFLEGHLRYRKYNWRDGGVRASVYHDALQRHMFAWWNGENLDTDSDLPHLWKAIACLAILIDAEECGVLNDDRPPIAPVGRMITELKAVVAQMVEHIQPSQYRLPDDFVRMAEDSQAEEDELSAATSAMRGEDQPDFQEMVNRHVKNGSWRDDGFGVVLEEVP